MNREKLIKFIPKPSNSDVIVYDISLSDFININVLEEYQKILPVFLEKKTIFLNLKEKINEYKKSIDNLYLYKKSWTKEDYLQALQDNKKTYAIVYSKRKKIEDNIFILNKKIDTMNEKIQMQMNKEEKEKNKKLENIDQNIELNKNKLLELKDKLLDLNLSYSKINKMIEENNDEFNDLQDMQKQLETGKFRCNCCGTLIKSCSENSNIYKRMIKNFENNKNELEKLLERKNKLELDIAYLENDIKTIKTKLNNDIEFKKKKNNFHEKKSLEVLKLEALRDNMINNVFELEKQLKNDSSAKSERYQELKLKITKYEESLNNLARIEEIKLSLKQDIADYNKLKEEIKKIVNTLNKYITFIKIYFKIYEQKASQYFGKDFKFKLFKFDEYVLKEIFEVYYQDIEYSQLDKKTKDKIDKIFIEKVSIYD